MTIEVFSEFCKGGRLLLPYLFVREVGLNTTCVLSELLAEYNFARNNKVDNYLGFIFDVGRASKMLNADYDGIISQLNYLQEIGFIEIEEIGIEDSLYIIINDDKIISLKKEAEKKNFSNNWDDGLLASINPTHKEVDFSESTLEIKQYFNSHSKEPKSIPMLDYLLLNKLIKENEKIFGNIFSYISNMDSFLQKCAAEDNSRKGLDSLYYSLLGFFNNKKKELKPTFDEIPPDC